MEERLNATYLRPGLIERGVALGVVAVGSGAGILLAAWGISHLLRPPVTEIPVRIINPEIRFSQDSPVLVTEEKKHQLTYDSGNIATAREPTESLVNSSGAKRAAVESNMIRRESPSFQAWNMRRAVSSLVGITGTAAVECPCNNFAITPFSTTIAPAREST